MKFRNNLKFKVFNIFLSCCVISSTFMVVPAHAVSDDHEPNQDRLAHDEHDEHAGIPLYDAVVDNQPDRVRTLIAAGADVNAVNQRGMLRYTALHFAADSGNLPMVNLLLSAPNINVDARDSEGCTPLHRATAGGHNEVVRQLIAHNATVDAEDGAGYTALHFASASGHTAVVQSLLYEGDANIDAQQGEDDTALTLAIRDGRDDVVGVLMNRRANVNLAGALGNTPLHEAILCDNVELVRNLVATGALPDAQNDNGDTPLIFVAAGLRWSLGVRTDDDQEAFDMAEILLNARANCNIADDDGRTALHEAIERNQVRLVRLLLQHGARLDIRDNDGNLPASLAISPEMRDLLHNYTNRSNR